MNAPLKLITVGPCKFCGKIWHPRKPEMPQRCAQCKRPNWAERKASK